MSEVKEHLKTHYINRSNWIRAAVLGANDGIISVSSLAIGIAAASSLREPVVLATLAALVAGALSMAAGEYVSVSSQTDLEKAEIKRESEHLHKNPQDELRLLALIYEERGLNKETALQVATELMATDALGSHIRDELGINETNQANPIQAAFASFLAFTFGGILPLLVALLAPIAKMEGWLYVTTIASLIILGITSAKAGGTNITKPVLRITIWGSLAMGITAATGYFFGTTV